MAKNNAINILIIEDNEDDLFFIKKALPSDRYHIIDVIHKGSEGYDYLLKSNKKPDVVLLDKNLPEMNGIEILENLQKQNIEYSFIFLTVDKDINTVINAMKLGALDFIVKSASLKDELPEKIEKIYQHHLDKIEKKRAEKALKESENRFRAMFKNSPIAYQSLDKNGYIIDVNERLCKMLGYEPDELLGNPFADLWPEKHKASFPGAFEHFKEQGFITADFELTKKDGQIITVILEGRVQTNSKGQFERTHCILHNITQRKMMENALSEQYGFQRMVAEISSSFINIADEPLHNKIDAALQRIGEFYNVDRCYISLFLNETQTGTITIVNEWCSPGIEPQANRLKELPWIKFPWFYKKIKNQQLIHIPDVNNMPKIAKAEQKEFQLQNISSLICLPMINKNDIIGFLGFDSVKEQKSWSNKQIIQLGVLEKAFTNAILRKQSEDALKESEFKYKTVSEYAYNWEYWISEGNEIIYMSPSVETITGYKAEEFINNPSLIDKIIHKDDLKSWKEHRAISNNPKQKKDCCETEFRIIKKSGEERWINHLCRKIFSDNGKFLGFRVSNQDITEKVEAEKRLINLTTEVEERERSRFSMEIHDGLGPILSNIKLYFQWLSETNDAEKARMITQKGNQSIDLAIQATREIAYNLNPSILHKHGLINALQDLVQRINETEKLKINLSYNSKKRFDKNTEKTLYYIVSELINNTLKHAKATEVNINFNINDNNKIISLTYTDNGVGFDVDKAKDLNNTEGLGLWNIMKKINTFRGSINIYSNPGKGMKVYIELSL